MNIRLLHKSVVIGKIILTNKQLNEINDFGICNVYTDNPIGLVSQKEIEIIKRINSAESIIVNISTPISKKIINQCENLKFIQTWSTGTDHIDVEYAKKRGIIIDNVPDFSVETIAEKTLCMMIFISNKMKEANDNVKQGRWDYTSFQGVELKNKILGIVGKGKIGSRVEELAKSFGMTVLSTNSKSRKSDLYDMLSQSDFISVHCPLTKNTKYLIDNEAFLAMKKGCFFINNSRGGVVDESSLLCALDNGIVTYASIDVLEKEPPEENNPMLKHPNIYLTPHMTWNSKESVEYLTQCSIDNLIKFCKGGYETTNDDKQDDFCQQQ